MFFITFLSGEPRGLMRTRLMSSKDRAPQDLNSSHWAPILDGLAISQHHHTGDQVGEPTATLSKPWHRSLTFLLTHLSDNLHCVHVPSFDGMKLLNSSLLGFRILEHLFLKDQISTRSWVAVTAICFSSTMFIFEADVRGRTYCVPHSCARGLLSPRA